MPESMIAMVVSVPSIPLEWRRSRFQIVEGNGLSDVSSASSK
jgi:hypothetical protein